MNSGNFSVTSAIPFNLLDEIRETGGDAHLLPLETGLADLPELILTPEGVSRVRNGNPGTVTYSDLDFGDECWVSHAGEPIAIGTYRAGTVAPTRVFVKTPA